MYVAFARRRAVPCRIVGWQTSTSLYTDLAQGRPENGGSGSASEKARTREGLVQPHAAGVRLYRAIPCAGRPCPDCDTVASVGSKGDLLSASLWPRP